MQQPSHTRKEGKGETFTSHGANGRSLGASYHNTYDPLGFGLAWKGPRKVWKRWGSGKEGLWSEQREAKEKRGGRNGKGIGWVPLPWPLPRWTTTNWSARHMGHLYESNHKQQESHDLVQGGCPGAFSSKTKWEGEFMLGARTLGSVVASKLYRETLKELSPKA